MNECIFCVWSVAGVELSHEVTEDELMNLKPLLKCKKTGLVANKRCSEFVVEDWSNAFSQGD